MIKVELSNLQPYLDVDSKRLIKAARSVLEAESVSRATISLAIVDDTTIHELNRKFLSHDYATDVLSFLLSEEDDHLEGEVIVSAETAMRTAVDYDWPASHELILYVIHGMLHLTGYGDGTKQQRVEMRENESLHLKALGISPPRNHSMLQQPPADDGPQVGGNAQCATRGACKP